MAKVRNTSVPIYRRRWFWSVTALVIVAVLAVVWVLLTQNHPVKDAHVAAVSKINIKTQPTGATITLDGKEQSKKTDTTLSASVGNHTVNLHLNGYDDQEIKVIVREKEPADVEHTFTRNGLTVLPSTAPGATPGIPAGGLKTYTNEKAGYHIQYPADWKVDPQGDVAHFYNALAAGKLASKPDAEVEESLAILVQTNSDNLPPKTWFEKEFGTLDPSANPKELTIGGHSAYQADPTPGFVPYRTTAIFVADKVFIVQQKSGSPERQIYDQLLQTFGTR